MWILTPSKCPVVSLNKKLYPYCLALVGSRHGFKRDFTIKLKYIEGLMADWLKCQEHKKEGVIEIIVIVFTPTCWKICRWSIFSRKGCMDCGLDCTNASGLNVIVSPSVNLRASRYPPKRERESNHSIWTFMIQI